jgi:multidrug transporter EmrE-like cation transporter
MHFLVLYFKIEFPGYDHSDKAEPIPMWMYFVLIVPSIFDLLATALCMFGLRSVNVSIYQMLRGSAIVFVAILKQYLLKDRLKKFMWIGVFWNVVSIVLVGLTAVFAMSGSEGSEGSGDAGQGALQGVMLILLGAFVQSLQYAFEEKVMTHDIAAPPLLLIGMEGLWGTLLCLFVFYPIAYYYPGPDHGSYENIFNTWYMLSNTWEIQKVFLVYYFSIFFYNVLAVLVTYTLNSVWHAILDNFRPITVWVCDLFIYYCITRSFGESWTIWSYLQLGGLFVLLYGTAIYNAPNSGSLELRGEWYSFYMDFSEEYEEIKSEQTETDSEPFLITSSFAAGTPIMTPRRAARTMKSPVGGIKSPGANYGGTDQGFSLQALRKMGSFA